MRPGGHAGTPHQATPHGQPRTPRTCSVTLRTPGLGDQAPLEGCCPGLEEECGRTAQPDSSRSHLPPGPAGQGRVPGAHARAQRQLKDCALPTGLLKLGYLRAPQKPVTDAESSPKARRVGAAQGSASRMCAPGPDAKPSREEGRRRRRAERRTRPGLAPGSVG